MPLNESQINFETALKTFVEGCAKIHTDYMRANYPNLKPDVIDSSTGGKRYVRIVRTDGNSRGRSVHCFVDRTNGDILKAAGWKAPAKHARGNIFDDRNGLGRMGEYGPSYLR